MIAAIYARKSTDQHVADEEKSVTRQLERARQYAARKGWTVDEAHVYQDDGISGAEFRKRPGFLALMNALRPRPAFAVLIVMDQSRLGRSQDEIPYALRRITDAGVRIFSYLRDAELQRATAADKFMINAIAFVDEMAREQASERTWDAMRRKAERGHVAGGACYGYRNVRRDGHVDREIVPAEAAVIIRIFTLAAEGLGLVRIAKTLTAAGIPKPHAGRGRGWAPSAIREMLARDLYRGVIVWNKMQRIDRDGTRAKRPRPESEWLRVDAPELRIVDAALWDAAHGVLAPRRVAYLRGVERNDEGEIIRKGIFLGRPEGTIESRYLLSGLARCGGCGGSIYGLRKTSRAHSRDYYGCFYHRTRGALACANGLTLPQDEADPLVLEALRRDVLAPAAVARTVADTLAAWRAQGATPAARETIAARLSVLERELRALTDTLARGAAFDSVAEAIAAREQERDALRRQQATGDERARIAGLDPSRVAAELTARLME